MHKFMNSGMLEIVITSNFVIIEDRALNKVHCILQTFLQQLDRKKKTSVYEKKKSLKKKKKKNENVLYCVLATNFVIYFPSKKKKKKSYHLG